MGDDDYGNRVGLWFWEMLANIGVTDNDDNHYNDGDVSLCLDKFNYRDYDPDGTGCAFRLHRQTNIENIELWYQLQYYLSEVINNDE